MKNCPYCDEEIRDSAIKCKHCGSMLSDTPTPGPVKAGHKGDPLDSPDTELSYDAGALIGGRYQVLFRLGEGGMGKVYLTRDEALADMPDLPEESRLRAVKVLPSRIGQDRRAVKALKNEAALAATLNDPHIVRFYYYDYHPNTQTHYLVMEYVNGIDLQTCLGVRDRFPETEVRRIAIGLAKGLKHAHEKRLVHRDIKPSNVLLESPNLNIEEIKSKHLDQTLTEADLPDLTGAKVKLTDFGIARQVRESMSRYSKADTSGTLPYMSPEQIRGKGIDHRSDLYSVGITLYELLTGDPPFKGEGEVLMRQIIQEEPDSIPDIDPRFNSIILKLIGKEKESRFRDADELIAALEGKEDQEEEKKRTGESERKRREVEKQRKEAEARAGIEAELAEKKRREAERRAADEEGRRRKDGEEKAARLRVEEEERRRREEGRKRFIRSIAIMAVVILVVSVIGYGAYQKWQGGGSTDSSGTKGGSSAQAPAPAPAPAPAAPAAPAVSAEEQKRTEGLQYLDRAKKVLGKGRIDEAREYYEEAQKRIPEEKSFKEFGKKLDLAAAKVKEAAEKAKKEAEEKAIQAAAKAKQEAEKRITNSLGMGFVLIPAGTFMMGSPSDEPGRYDDESQHRVTISRAFYMQTTEVTQAQWRKVMGNNPSNFKNCGDDCPVENVSWNDVQEFIRKLNSQEGMDKYRLPTEAEWEYAARAGTTTAYSFGDDAGRLGDYAWYDNNSGRQTHAVGQKRPNGWGLYDMHGNVWEWVQDWYGNYPTGSVTDPMGPSSGSVRVIRGGSWNFFARFCRSAYRYIFDPGDRNFGLGFRLARTK